MRNPTPGPARTRSVTVAALVPGAWVLLGVLAGLLPAPARAEAVTFQVSGSLTSVDLSRPGDPLAAIFSPLVAVGDTITITYTFDSTATDIVPSDPTDGRYENLISFAEVRIGSDGFSMFPKEFCGNCGSSIIIQNDFTGGGGFWDRFDVRPRYSFGGNNYQVLVSLFSAAPWPTSGMTSDQLPLLAPDPAAFLDNYGYVSAGIAGPPSLAFRPLAMATVPVLPAAGLFGSALGLLGWMRRRAMHD